MGRPPRRELSRAARLDSGRAGRACQGRRRPDGHGVNGGFASGPVSLWLVTGPTPTPDETPPTPDEEPATGGSPQAAAAPPGPHRPSGAINLGPVEYKGEPLDAERGPGLGCFRIQLVVLVVLILATPLSVGRVPDVVTAALLFVTIALLLVSGQTIIFLLRLVAAERRGRRQPLAPRSPTVGQLEDASARTPEDPGADPPATGPVRQ